MKIAFLPIAAACLVAAMPSMVSATVINFDVDGLGGAIAANTPITNQYANLGVLFQGIEDGDAVNINAAPDPDGVLPPSSPNVLTNCANAAGGCPGNRADIVRITFAAPVSGVSLKLDSLGGDFITFNLYDAIGNLLETQTLTSGGSLYIPVSFAATGVSRIDGLQPNDGWGWAMDDLSFQAGVPEPATWAMMIGGFGMIGAVTRRRQRVAVTYA